MNDQLTPGQTAGFLQLSSTAVWRYVRDFPEFFSESAKLPRRRRFTPGDIKTLRIIRALYHRKADQAAVRAALESGDNLGPADELENATMLLARAEAMVKRAELAAQQTDAMRQKLNNALTPAMLEHTLRQVWKNALGREFADVKTLLQEVAALKADIESIKATMQSSAEDTKPKKNRWPF